MGREGFKFDLGGAQRLSEITPREEDPAPIEATTTQSEMALKVWIAFGRCRSKASRELRDSGKLIKGTRALRREAAKVTAEKVRVVTWPHCRSQDGRKMRDSGLPRGHRALERYEKERTE